MKNTEEKATVSEIHGEFVFLETQNFGSCENCTSKKGCGQVNSIFKFKTKNKLKLKSLSLLNLKVGDEVIVSLPSDKLIKATMLMYLSPLIFLFIFSLFAKLMFGETASIFMGIMGLVLGLLIVNQYAKHQSVAKDFEPKLVRKIINLESA